MSKLYLNFKTDPSKEKDGIWVELDFGDEKPAFKIGRMGDRNKHYLRILEKATRPYKKAIEHNVMDKELAYKIYMEIFVDAIMLDWRGVIDESGNEMVFNRDNAIKLFTDLPDIYKMLQEDSQNAALFKEEQLKEDSKN